MFTHKITFTTLALIAVLCTACTTHSPAVDTSKVRSFDGLLPVKGLHAENVWVREDLNMSPYNKIMLKGTAIEFRPIDKSSPSKDGEDRIFPVSEDIQKSTNDILREAFYDELQKTTRFTFVTKPGPDVLTVYIRMFDIVSYRKNYSQANTYLSPTGKATMMIEMIDSESGAVLIRSVDRQVVESIADPLDYDPASNKLEGRRFAYRWAKILRTTLEALADKYDAGKTQ
jgi:hypothetical protein